MLNEKGYNEGVGVGCLAEYFRDQSNGRLNIQFDVYGPFKVTQTAGGHGSSYFGVDVMRDAVKQLYDTEKTDFSIYDWKGDGKVSELFFVAASYAGNQNISGLILRTNTFCCQGISIPTFVRSPQSCGETVP